jgi:hypothetical protein
MNNILKNQRNEAEPVGVLVEVGPGLYTVAPGLYTIARPTSIFTRFIRRHIDSDSATFPVEKASPTVKLAEPVY